jgi:hypothetical protein
MNKTRFKPFLDDKPKVKGWYATLHCWDIEEGMFPGAAYWEGDRFDTDLPITAFIDHVFETEQAADDAAWENDPNW